MLRGFEEDKGAKPKFLPCSRWTKLPFSNSKSQKRVLLIFYTDKKNFIKSKRLKKIELTNTMELGDDETQQLATAKDISSFFFRQNLFLFLQNICMIKR